MYSFIENNRKLKQVSHLFCPPLPASANLSDSSLVGPKSSAGDLGCYGNNYK